MLFIVINGSVNMRKQTAQESLHSIIISFFLHSINDVKNILWNKSLQNSLLPKLLKLTPSKSKIHNTLSLHNKVAKLQKNAQLIRKIFKLRILRQDNTIANLSSVLNSLIYVPVGYFKEPIFIRHLLDNKGNSIYMYIYPYNLHYFFQVLCSCHSFPHPHLFNTMSYFCTFISQ